MQPIRENINPSILRFSRERLGYGVPDIARKLRVNEEKWNQWESGEEKPTTNQLIRISATLDRTPAFFYLQKVPEEREPLSEFRTLNNHPLDSASPKLLKAIREAKRNRDSLLELTRNQKKRPQDILRLQRNGIIAEQAKEIREWLEVTFEEQSGWAGSSQALTKWKTFIENKDIYVIQFPFVEVSESRGFALSEEQFPIIGINSKDSYNARIFTLMHELCHVLFRDSVIINDELTQYFNNGNSEQQCNRLAAEILVSAEILSENYNRNGNPYKEVKRLSNLFGVSGYVMLIRLKNEQLVTNEMFNELIDNFSFYGGSGKPSEGGDPYRNQIVRKGKLYIRTAFQSYFENQITIAELANLTGWKVPNLNKLAAKTYGWPEEGQYV